MLTPKLATPFLPLTHVSCPGCDNISINYCQIQLSLRPFDNVSDHKSRRETKYEKSDSVIVLQRDDG